MTRLISQAALMSSDYSGAAWHKKVLLSLQARLSPPSDVPCTFSQNAFRRQLLLLSFIEDISQQGLAQSRADLLAYVEHSRRWDGQVNSARPLVMAFSHAAVPAFGLTQQHILGWEILQNWHDNDPTPWPDKVATDPDHAFWSMCFAGMQLFINMSSPAYQNRKSRILGDHFLFIINPRERFDLVAGDTPEGHRVRAAIRRRIKAYDGMDHAPELGRYQAGEIEWRQYCLSDTNAVRHDRCPFKASPD